MTKSELGIGMDGDTGLGHIFVGSFLCWFCGFFVVLGFFKNLLFNEKEQSRPSLISHKNVDNWSETGYINTIAIKIPKFRTFF